MPYLYFGKTSLYKGRPLFKLLCRLKDFGRGRIVYRTIDQYDHPGEVSFYRILLAQPQMDSDTLHGRVVAERVYKGRRMKEPEVLSAVAHKPDFRLVPKDEEDSFCQWDKILDYEPKRDAPHKSKYMDMPPLLKEVMRQNRLNRGQSVSDETVFNLPAHKIYRGDVNLADDVLSHNMEQYLTDEYSTHNDFDLSKIPKEWGLERYNAAVGRKKWYGFKERTKEWTKQQVLEEEAAETERKWSER